MPAAEKYEPNIPDEDEIAKILTLVEGTNVELPVTIAVTLGLRQSEIAALKWEDYDGEYIYIHSSRVPDKNNKLVVKNTTKSQASTRILEVDSILKERLDRAKHTSEYISTMQPNSVLKRFQQLCEREGLPHFTMHGQRHGNASLMLAQGVPDKYAMERLGQSSPNMIKNIYQHLYDAKKKEVSKTMSSKFAEIMKNQKVDTKVDT
jgi:integrase